MTTSSSEAVAARRHFDQAMALMESDRRAARERFTQATSIDRSMADAWLGRIAAGDEALTTLQECTPSVLDCTARPTDWA